MSADEVEVFRGRGGDIERGFLESALQEEGITCLVKSRGAIAQHPVTVGPMAEFSIFVAPEDEDRARALIQRLTEGAQSVEEVDDAVDEDTAPTGFLGRI